MELEKLLNLIEIGIELDCKKLSFETDVIDIKTLRNEIKFAVVFLEKYSELLDKKF